MSLKAKADAISAQLRALILEHLRSTGRDITHRRGFADGYWEIVVHVDGSVTLRGYAVECADWRTLDELPLTELAQLADTALSS